MRNLFSVSGDFLFLSGKAIRLQKLKEPSSFEEKTELGIRTSRISGNPSSATGRVKLSLSKLES